MPVWSGLTNLVVQVRAQSQRENSKLRTQLRRQMATAKELSQEVERLRSALVEHKQQREAAALRLADAERQVRRAVCWPRYRVCSLRVHSSPRWKAASFKYSSCRACWPRQRPAGDIDICGFVRIMETLHALRHGQPPGVRDRPSSGFTRTLRQRHNTFYTTTNTHSNKTKPHQPQHSEGDRASVSTFSARASEHTWQHADLRPCSERQDVDVGCGAQLHD